MSADRALQAEEARRWLRVVDRGLGAARLCLEGTPVEPETATTVCPSRLGIAGAPDRAGARGRYIPV